MYFSKITKRSEESRKASAKKVRQPTVQPLESRRLMSVVPAPDFPAHADAGAAHFESAALQNSPAASFHATPVLGLVGNVSPIPQFAQNVNGFSFPVGLIGGNLVGTHGPTDFYNSNGFASAITATRVSTETPAIVGSLGTNSATANIAGSGVTGTGLLSLIHQTALTDMIESVGSTASTAASSDVQSVASAVTQAASSVLRATAAEISANVNGMNPTPGVNFDAIVTGLPTLVGATAGPAIAAVETMSHTFADSADSVEQLARSVGDAFLRSLLTDLADFDSGVDSAVTQLSQTLNWRAAAVAGAAIALGAYSRSTADDEKKKTQGSWLSGHLVVG